MTDTDDNLISVAPIPSTPTQIQILHEWQLCPKCRGTGSVWSTGWPYNETFITTAPVQCDVCYGKMIISKLNGLPPA